MGCICNKFGFKFHNIRTDSYAIVDLLINEFFYENNKNQNKKSIGLGVMGW